MVIRISYYELFTGITCVTFYALYYKRRTVIVIVIGVIVARSKYLRCCEILSQNKYLRGLLDFCITNSTIHIRKAALFCECKWCSQISQIFGSRNNNPIYGIYRVNVYSENTRKLLNSLFPFGGG